MQDLIRAEPLLNAGTGVGGGIIIDGNIFRPDAIILGGGISAEGMVLTDPLNERLNKGILGGNDYATVKLLSSSLANDAGLFGAVRLAMTNTSER